MTKKSIRSLIIVGAIALALALVLLLLTLLPRLKNGGEEDSLPLLALGEISSLTLDCGEERCTFEKQQNTWVYTLREDYPIGQNRLTRLAAALSSLTAQQSFSPESSLADYGLDTPANTITAADQSGKQVTLSIGNACGDSSYYAMTEGSETIAVIDSSISGYLGYTLMQMLDAGSTPAVIEADQQSLELSQGGRSARFTQKDSHWYYEEADGTFTKEDDIPAQNTAGEDTTLRGVLNDLSNSLSSYKTSLLAGYNMTEAQLKAMGMDTPLTVTYTEADGDTVIYLFGESTVNEEGAVCRYLMVPDSPAVYVAENAEVLFALFEQFACE